MAGELGFTEVALFSADSDFVEFYMGETALAEFADTGRFVPSPEKAYSMLRVPVAFVDNARASANPYSHSLCDARAGITLFHNAVGESHHAPSPEEIENCTPWVTHYEGRMTIEYFSGQEGVYGAVQVGVAREGEPALHANGTLFAGAVMDGWLPSACEGDTSFGESSMRLGTWYVADPEPDDPLLETCAPPSAPEEGL